MDHVESSHWVISLPDEEAYRAARLRHLPDVEVLPTANEVWFRGRLSTWTRAIRSDLERTKTSRASRTLRADSESLAIMDAQVRQKLFELLPGERPYLVSGAALAAGISQDRALTVVGAVALTAVGDRVPSKWLPTGDWIPLAEWLQVELPIASRVSHSGWRRVTLTLVRCFQESVPNLLMTQWSLFGEYVATAPSWRLERLSFAADDTDRVIVRGTPLLPIPGQQWVERDGIATAAGWTWQPAIDAKILRRKFGLHSGDLVLLEASQWQKIPAANWVRLTRSAVRSTLEAKDAR